MLCNKPEMSPKNPQTNKNYRSVLFGIDHEVISDTVYHFFNKNCEKDPIMILLQEYSAKQCLWGDEDNYHQILMGLDGNQENLMTSMGYQLEPCRVEIREREGALQEIHSIQSQNDGIVEDLCIDYGEENSDCIVESPDYEVLDECMMSETSLKFMRDNSISEVTPVDQK